MQNVEEGWSASAGEFCQRGLWGDVDGGNAELSEIKELFEKLSSS